MTPPARAAAPKHGRRRRRVCFVTGTRAEFGLMRTVLEAIRDHPKLELQIIATGMHLHAGHGRTIDTIRRQGWKIDATVPWKPAGDEPAAHAQHMGLATAGLARALGRLRSDVVLVVGDRVEAFAAAAAGHVSQRVVAHVHGGDRALGQVDDALRHAITKLAHVHFPATAESAARIIKLGEDAWRVHRVGSPGIDGIRRAAAPRQVVRAVVPHVVPHRFGLVLMHPVEPDPRVEQRRAQRVLAATRRAGVERIVIVGPNNDPGADGIIDAWKAHTRGANLDGARVSVHADLPRGVFLGLLRDAAVLVGNSSSGIIEAASFGTPVVNVGQRQDGRERSGNVTDVSDGEAAIRRAVGHIWNDGNPVRWRGRNVYGGGGAGRKIADILGRMRIDERLQRKLIRY